MGNKKRINSLVDANLHKQFKTTCAMQNKSMTIVLEMLMQAYLLRSERKEGGAHVEKEVA